MFRYSASTWNENLIEKGELRIGTLFDFRKREHKKGISDPNEGKKQLIHPIQDVFVDGHSNPGLEDMNRFGVWDLGENPQIGVHFAGFLQRRSFEAPNAFILCTSSVASWIVMRQFEGADSCVKIESEKEFYSLLTTSLNNITPVEFLGVHAVAYKERAEIWNRRDFGIHPALIKERKFRMQSEKRAIWRPLTGNPIEPIIIANIELGKLCSRVSI